MELNESLGENLGNGFHIEAAWCVNSIHDVKGICTQVRSRLLDFMLELKDTVGEASTPSEIKEKSTLVDTSSLFNNAIFGPNTTIVVGHHVNQHVHNETIKGDTGKLKTALENIGIPSDEIEGLEQAIDADKAGGNGPSFSGETGRWYSKLLARAAEGGMKIGVDVVTSEVGKLLGNYLGVS